MRPARDRLLRGPSHDPARILRLDPYVGQLLATVPQPDAVLGEEDGSRPGQRIVDDDRPEGVHIFVCYIRWQRT